MKIDVAEVTLLVDIDLDGVVENVEDILCLDCDGLKIDSKGTIFASGPGGIWIMNSQAKVLGKLRLDEAASNVALSADEKTIYITNDMQVLRFRMRD